jgi:DNA repair protein SbcC/Rad50
LKLDILIKENGYYLLENEYLDYKDTPIKYLHFKRSADIQFKDFSEYFMVEVTESVSEALFKKNIENFIEFQTKLIADTFFNYKNDIRWNIYLILLVTEKDILEDIPVRDIEKDTNYARKLIYDEAELESFLSGDIYKGTSDDTSKVHTNISPESIWIKELNKINLTGCLTQDFQEKNIDTYLKTKEFNDGSIMDLDEVNYHNESNIPIVNSVSLVDIAQLNRPCFSGETTLKPVQVNLLHGANGTGKTSFLETLELGITGENSRSKLFKEEFNNDIKVFCTTNKGELEFRSHRTPLENKKLDSRWYGTPIGRGKATLNKNFSLFNYFDADKPYRFALEETVDDTENQYLNRFSQLIFGDHIVKMQKNWIRYNKGFESRHKKLISEDMDIKEKIENLNIKIKKFKELNPINDNYFNNSFSKVELRENLYEVYDGVKEETIKKITEILKYLEKPIKNIEELGTNFNTLTVPSLNSHFKNLNEQKEIFERRITKSKSKLNNLEEKKLNIEDEIKKINNDKENLNRLLDELENSRYNWLNNKKIIINHEIIQKRDFLNDDLNKVDKQLSLINKIRKNWPELSEINDISNYVNMDNLIELEERKLDIEGNINLIEGKIKDYKKYIGEVREIQIKIKNLGLEYLEQEGETDNCPLCGLPHYDHTELVENIKQLDGFTRKESVLAEWGKERNKLKRALNHYNEELGIVYEKEKVKNVIFECFNTFFRVNDKEISLEKAFSVIVDFLNQDSELNIARNRLIALIKDIEDEGINDKAIKNSRYFLNRDKFYNHFKQKSKTEDFESFLLQLEESYNNKFRVDKNSLDTLNENLRKVNGELFKVKNVLKKSNNDNEENYKRIKRTKDALNSINNITNYFKISDNKDLFIWINDVMLLKDNLEKAMSYLNQSNDVESYVEQIMETKVKQGEIEKNIIDCQRAIGILSGLPKHEKFVQTFIKNNLTKIEYLFKSIHSPKEFTSLEFDETGIIAIREKGKSKSKAHQMSTGQRVSLALAVMFTHFLAAQNAPKVLLLDEPVANMDDLHLLNLLDIIRELALRGTQIIFTTANPDVAGLFRRKFSFFGKEFKQFEFIRQDSGFTKVKELIFSPYLEEEILNSSM